MSDIFISYSSADREKARELAELLAKKGWTVWWDRTIPPGREYDEVIEEALNAARCVIVLWSKASIASSWVKNEAADAMDRKILVPAVIEGVKLPLEFRRLQAADLTHWNGEESNAELVKLFQAIERLAPHAAAEHPPSPPSLQPAIPPANLRQASESAGLSGAPRASDADIGRDETGPTARREPQVEKHRSRFPMFAALAIVIAAVVGYFIYSRHDEHLAADGTMQHDRAPIADVAASDQAVKDREAKERAANDRPPKDLSAKDSAATEKAVRDQRASGAPEVKRGAADGQQAAREQGPRAGQEDRVPGDNANGGGRAGPLRSHEDRTETAVTFVNHSGAPLLIYWVDYEGKEVLYNELARGQTYVAAPTYVTHVWRVRRKRDSSVARTIVASKEPQTIEIGRGAPGP